MSANRYTERIAGAHVDAPMFADTVYASTQSLADVAALAAGLPQAFDLDTAEGAQLDAVGVRVGIGRRVKTPLSGVYFALDDEMVGFDLGVWRGQFDPAEGVSVLDDDTYRTVLRARIAANAWDGANGSIQKVLDIVFTDGMHAMAEDGQDMSMVIAVSGKRPPPILLALLTQGYLSVKPAGVRIAYYITATADGPLFGFDAQNDSIAGFNSGVFGKLAKGS